MLRVAILTAIVVVSLAFTQLPASAGGWSGDGSGDIRDGFGGGTVLTDFLYTLDR